MIPNSSSTSQLPVVPVPENDSTRLGHPHPTDDNISPELSDNVINNYMHIYEKNSTHKSIFKFAL